MDYSVTELAGQSGKRHRQKRQEDGDREHQIFAAKAERYLDEKAIHNRRIHKRQHLIWMLLVLCGPCLPLIIWFSIWGSQ